MRWQMDNISDSRRTGRLLGSPTVAKKNHALANGQHFRLQADREAAREPYGGKKEPCVGKWTTFQTPGGQGGCSGALRWQKRTMRWQMDNISDSRRAGRLLGSPTVAKKNHALANGQHFRLQAGREAAREPYGGKKEPCV